MVCADFSWSCLSLQLFHLRLFSLLMIYRRRRRRWLRCLAVYQRLAAEEKAQATLARCRFRLQSRGASFYIARAFIPSRQASPLPCSPCRSLSAKAAGASAPTVFFGRCDGVAALAYADARFGRSGVIYSFKLASSSTRFGRFAHDRGQSRDMRRTAPVPSRNFARSPDACLWLLVRDVS